MVFVVIIPWIGVLVYLIVNHDGMAERKVKEAQASQAQFDDYVRTTAGTGGAAAEIEKAKQLLDSGAISQSEFDALKAKASPKLVRIGRSSGPSAPADDHHREKVVAGIGIGFRRMSRPAPSGRSGCEA
jgi:Short C-terminal domain